MTKYLIKIKDSKFTIPKENLKLLAMTKGVFGNTDTEIIKKFIQCGCEISEVLDE